MRTGFDFDLRLCNGRQTGFTPSNLGRNIHTIGRDIVVCRLGPLNQGVYLSLELSFQLLGMTIGQRFVLAGIGFNLGAIEGDGAELEELHLTCQQQYLNKQLLQFG